MDNFDLKKYLVENKVTTQPKTVNEEIQKSLLDTSKYIEPKDMEDILEKMWGGLKNTDKVEQAFAF